MHLLHNGRHCRGGLVFDLLLLQHVQRNPLLVLRLKLLIFQEVAGHDTVDLFEVLEYGQSGALFLARHELLETVIRVYRGAGTSAFVESLLWTGRRSAELGVLVHDASDVLVVSRSWTTKQEMSLAQELAAVLGALDLLVIIEILTGAASECGRIIIHLLLQAHLTIFGIQLVKARCKEWVVQSIDETSSWTSFAGRALGRRHKRIFLLVLRQIVSVGLRPLLFDY